MLIINLLPGHGISNIKGIGYDPGATNKNGTQEAKGNEILANKLKYKLEFNGFKVNLLNNRDVNAQINFVNNNKCDLAISLHFNSGGGHGIEVLYSDIAPGYHQSTTLKFSNLLLKHLTNDTGLTNRGVKLVNSGVGIIKRAKYPTVLSENSFIDHPTEYLWALDDDKLEILADAHCKAVCQYFGVEHKNKEEDVDMAILNTKDSLNININDKKVYVENYIINDSTYVKLKDIVNLLSNNLFYDNNTKTINIRNIPVKIIVNNKELDGIIVNDKSYSPVKSIVENLGKTAEWDNINKMVIVK